MRAIFLAAASLSFLALALAPVFSGRVELPQSLVVGPLSVRYYGLIMAAALLAGWLLARRRAVSYGIPLKEADDTVFFLAIAGFLGARLYHVFSSLPYYLENPWQAVQIWHGGLSIFGALLGGGAALFFCSKKLKLSFASSLDWLAPSMALGQSIGRFGNLFNYEAYGYPTGLPWKMFVPEYFRIGGFRQHDYFHPWFLYEAAGNLLLLFLLLKLGRPKRPGLVAAAYFLLYNLWRFALEFLRVDSVFIGGGFRLNALTSGFLAALAILAICLILRNDGTKS